MDPDTLSVQCAIIQDSSPRLVWTSIAGSQVNRGLSIFLDVLIEKGVNLRNDVVQQNREVGMVPT